MAHRETHTLKQKLGQLLTILLPILVTQISLTLVGFFDTVMSGRAGHLDLAGVAVGANLWAPVLTGLNGILSGITPILAQLHGAGNREEMPFQVIQGIYLAGALTALVAGGGWLALDPLLRIMALDPAVEKIAHDFLNAIAWGMPPLFLSAVLRNFIDALGYTRVTMGITVCAIPVCILFNYLLIFGEYGFPRLGGAGAGYASAITYWCLALITVGIICRKAPFKDYHLLKKGFGISGRSLRELLQVGLPIGLAIFCEVSIFSVVALLMAEFGTAVIGAHQAAINFAGLVYMVPLSISMALTILVGFEAGAKRYADARQYSYLGIGIAVVIALSGAVALSIFKDPVAGLYTRDPEVFQLIKSFLTYAVFFQLSDAVAAPIQGALRGYKDVRVTLFLAILSYWIIGMPAGYVLANYFPFGPYGYWIGLIAGLAVGAMVLFLRLRRLQRNNMAVISNNG